MPADTFLLIRLQLSRRESFNGILSIRQDTLYSRTVTMLPRHAHPAGTPGRAARTLLSPSRTIAAPTWRLASLTCATQTQTRFSSSRDISHGIPHLQPPWQVSDLSQFEQSCYAKYGPNYADHLKSPERRNIKWKAALRAQQSNTWQGKFGDDWYEIVKEANKTNAENYKAKRAEWLQRSKLAKSRLLSAKKAPRTTNQAVEIQLAKDELDELDQENREMLQQSRKDMEKIAEELARSRGVGKIEES